MSKDDLTKQYRLLRRAKLLMCFMTIFPSIALAESIEFHSISENAAIMYDAPSLKADKLYVANRHLPVEIVVEVDGWAKVRDSSGGLAWVEKKALSAQRYVVVIAPLASIHQAADINSALVFQAEQDIVLEWLSTEATGWVKIRHPDGQTGYIKTNQVWGS